MPIGNLAAHLQKLSALGEADGIVAIGQLLILSQLLAHIVDLLVGMDEEAALVVQHNVAANLQGADVGAISLLLDELLNGAQTEGQTTSVAHAVPQYNGQHGGIVVDIISRSVAIRFLYAIGLAKGQQQRAQQINRAVDKSHLVDVFKLSSVSIVFVGAGYSLFLFTFVIAPELTEFA